VIALSVWNKLPAAERRVAVAGLVSAVLYGTIAWLSPRFEIAADYLERPVWEVLGLLAASYAIYAYTLRWSRRCASGPRLWCLTIVPAVAFRLILVGTTPILENDLYRYVWDGNAAAAGVSPYRYSPRQVLKAELNDPLDDDLATLVRLRHENAGLRSLLEQVSYPELPTIYPPVSQWVFTCAALTAPSQATAAEHLTVMKLWLTLFDVAALVALIALLRYTGMHPGWNVAWGWCPLVVKEFSNTGHLDSVAVFLTIATVLSAVRAAFAPVALRRRTPATLWNGVVTGVLLGLAIGAKLYPLVLTPLLATLIWRKCGRGPALASMCSVAVVTLIVLRPMWVGFTSVPNSREAEQAQPASDGFEIEVPPVPRVDARPQDPSGGLKAFLNRWEMNDFLFMIVVENLRSSQDKPPEQRPWFVIVPDGVRGAVEAGLSSVWDLDPVAATFRTARVITLVIFLLIAAYCVRKSTRTDNAAAWIESAFLTLAWFWLLAPTQFPWYWCWALAFIPYARSPAWLWLAGCSLYYYTRFWLAWHSPAAVLGTHYDGSHFYYFVAGWLAYGPWLVWLAASRLLGGRAAWSHSSPHASVTDFTDSERSPL